MIAIYIHEVEVFVRKSVSATWFEKPRCTSTCPFWISGWNRCKTQKIPAIQFSLAAPRLTSVVGFREFFSCLILPWVNQMHLSWFENVENTLGEIAFVNSNFRTHGVGRQHAQQKPARVLRHFSLKASGAARPKDQTDTIRQGSDH